MTDPKISQAPTGEPTHNAEPRKSTPKTERQDGIRVLARAAEILRLLRMSPGGLSQADLATQLGLARTTTHRIMNALAAHRLVQLSRMGGRYRLGPEILYMAEAARSALISEAHPVLQELSDRVQETVDLSVLDRDHVTFVDQVVSAQRLRAVSAVGTSFPLHCTANGKAILATLPTSDIRRLLPSTLEAMTSSTITSRSTLLKELEKIAAKGIAFDLEEHSLGICAIGASVGETPMGLAAISVPIPSQRFEEKRAGVTKAVAGAVKAIEKIFTE